ncbi:hypothetical protein LMG31884_06810 [Xanthomonas hydrangeae]|uniref:AAA family ATPase n=1 Tax=Xanthomonas hydrangeae TaxID=2775159 RepID=UPI0019627477|nr:hypothetical protein LMG31884_06810 [Xanthomonas hydrangeae]CAD7713584.1 hypothetical protein LMG31884_06810 [Xanthomonas hydrangeae]CAD7720358.1 hypothetical protein LMG31887_06810 [Xanthomonas hydrangeae]CAD7720362.1 hypothetical protein LMG31887_06810 [Xanthomonas hydrangeae]
MNSPSPTSNPSLPVYFSRTRPKRGQKGRPFVHISPSSNDWDDYGLQIRADFHVWNGTNLLSLPALVGFYGKDAAQKNGRTRLIQLVESSSELLPAENFKYFAMLPGMEYYRELVGHFGPKFVKKALLAARDLACWYHFKPNSSWLREAMKEDAFNISFMRDSESHFALYNAGHVIRGLNHELVTKPATSWHLTFKIANSLNSHSIKLRFDHSDVLPRRISIVIGKNGVGKSQALHNIARSLLTSGKALLDEAGARPQVSRLIAFSPSGEAASSFPKENGNYNTWYRKYSLNRSSHQPRDRRPSEVIIRLASSDKNIAGETRLNLFKSSLQALTEHEQLGVRVHSGDPIPLSELRAGTTMHNLKRLSRIDRAAAPVRVINGKSLPLSSGEVSFITFSAQLCECVENGSLILLDEPETHLHPNLISSFCALLERTLRLTGSSAIIATHSAYFVREVFREQVIVINRTNGLTEITKPRLRTFGADVGAISRFVFGEEDESKLAIQLKARILSQGSSWKKIYEAYKDELSIELLGAIRDEFEEKGEKL